MHYQHYPFLFSRGLEEMVRINERKPIKKASGKQYSESPEFKKIYLLLRRGATEVVQRNRTSGSAHGDRNASSIDTSFDAMIV